MNLAFHLVLFGAWFHIPTRLDGDETLVLYGFLAFIFLALNQKPRQNPDLHSFFPIVLWAIVTTCFNFRAPVRDCLINLSIGLATLALLTRTQNFRDNVFAKTLVVFFAYANGLLFMQALGLDPLYTPVAADDIPSATFQNPWVMGCAAALATPFLFRFSAPSVLLLVFPLWGSHSSICILAAFAGLAMALPRKYLRLLPLAVLIVAAYVVWDGGIENHRFTAWKNSWKHVDQYWLSGHGIGSWAHMGFRLFNGPDPYHWRWAHNEFYQHFVEQGVIGLALVAWPLWQALKTTAVEFRGALVALLVLCLFHPVLHWPKLIPIAIYILAGALASARPTGGPRAQKALGFSL